MELNRHQSASPPGPGIARPAPHLDYPIDQKNQTASSFSNNVYNSRIPMSDIPGVPNTGLPQDRDTQVFELPHHISKRDDTSKPNMVFLFACMLVMFMAGCLMDRIFQQWRQGEYNDQLPDFLTVIPPDASSNNTLKPEVRCQGLHDTQLQKNAQTLSRQLATSETIPLTDQKTVALFDRFITATKTLGSSFTDGSRHCTWGRDCEVTFGEQTQLIAETAWMSLNNPELDTWQELPASQLRERINNYFHTDIYDLSTFDQLQYDEETDTILTLGPYDWQPSYHYTLTNIYTDPASGQLVFVADIVQEQPSECRVWLDEQTACSCVPAKYYLIMDYDASGQNYYYTRELVVTTGAPEWLEDQSSPINRSQAV